MGNAGSTSSRKTTTRTTHDFGSFLHKGEKIFWKFDYYDPTLTSGSEHPADPGVTVRVLTILLANEY